MRTRVTFMAPALVVAVALVAAGSAAAQDWDTPWADPDDRPARFDLSLAAGWVLPTDWSDLVLLGTISPATGILEQVLVRNVRVEPARTLGLQATYWRGRYGFQTGVGRSSSTLAIGGAPFAVAGEPVDVDSWFYGVRGAIGLIEYAPRRWIWPYAFGGAGGITCDLARPVTPPLLTFVERPRSGDADLIVVDGGREFLLQVNELDLETVFALSFGVGVDLRVPAGPAGAGVRLEVANHVARSPLRVLIRELGPGAGGARVGLAPVHHLRASAGLMVQFGR
jgi:hypothetical protein